ncbi:MAG: hypothetical protein GX021_05705 [Tissierellia bacterium]|nr:hypothetical protein [Tissierellia bacterium]
MKNFFSNLGYFLKEAKTIFRIDFLSNIFSIFSIGLIFFILSMVISGWWLSKEVVEVLQKEAEINIYFEEGLDNIRVNNLLENIKSIKGVREANLVDKEESYKRMEEILEKEARILELFDENPFQPFIEVKIDISEVDGILEDLEPLENIDYIRDNKDIIDKLEKIITILTIVGILVITATGISTLVVISHIIRQGIYNNRDQINTLKLLGAPDSFIGFPFLLEGLFLTVVGGILAFGLIFFTFRLGYKQIGTSLLFIPLPSMEGLVKAMAIFILILSGALGIIGSFFGLSSAKGN